MKYLLILSLLIATLCPRAIADTLPINVRNVYTVTPVTTAAWTELVASTANATSAIWIFDSSGQTLELGVGTPGNEQRLMLSSPGGLGLVKYNMSAGTRVSIKAVSANATTGELNLVMFY